MINNKRQYYESLIHNILANIRKK